MLKNLLVFSFLISPAVASAQDDVQYETIQPSAETSAAMASFLPVDIIAEQIRADRRTTEFAPDADSDDDDIVSISFDDPYDINWQGALETNGAGQSPSPITLPLLNSYQIENVEIKFRVLNRKF